MRKLTIALLVILLPCLWLNAQKNTDGANTTKSSVVDCQGPIVRFVDKDFNEVDHVQIATWEDSFTAEGKVVPNFANVDEERFYLEVIYDDAVGNQLTVLLESFAFGVDPESSSASASDNQVAVVLNREGTTNLFRSTAKIVVTDLDEVDDNFDAPPPGTNEVDDGVAHSADGTDDGSDDVTIFGEAEGKLKAKFEDGSSMPPSKIVNIGNDSPNDVVLVKLRLIQIIDDVDSTPYFTSNKILEQIENAQRTWSQCGIRFVDTNEDILDENDIIPTPEPQAIPIGQYTYSVDLSDGLYYHNCGYNGLEMSALMNPLQDNDYSNIDVFFVSYILSDGPDLNSACDETIILGTNYANFQWPSIPNRTSLVLTTLANPFTFAHELGHILTEKGHYRPGPYPPGEGDPENYFINPPDANLLWELDLMKPEGTSTENTIRSSKRILKDQCELAKTATSLPIHQN